MAKPDLRVVGRSLPKVDAVAKVTGRTRFADDLFLPRMLHCKILRATTPHAEIRSIDVRAAAEMPGVAAVLVGSDLPIPYGILPVSQDEHTLCLDKVRFIGDPVAAVAAIDEEVAERACRAIVVDYAELDPVASIDDALDAEDPRIHLYGDGHNVHKAVAMEFGDVDAALAEA
ncbi:MAG TPA: aldehyde oxidase, partial [Gemmatimonadota bacterium]|nr:aldehyde oxidase [Gemmatimonadota bacterium]